MVEMCRNDKEITITEKKMYKNDIIPKILENSAEKL